MPPLRQLREENDAPGLLIRTDGASPPSATVERWRERRPALPFTSVKSGTAAPDS